MNARRLGVTLYGNHTFVPGVFFRLFPVYSLAGI